ncbi:hypothetical protein [Azoarcus sp. DN11]|uniref:hypothetical protein n=1 Tax=Azoarcus sp. DN11 TaxID=356837 RepID=UPI000EAE9CE9|nr:hypothetical protein [Azoarcus sp. DN11]AYH46089.1 hypothetical protein CDA09_22385 [Azoarcus sp. DN11]
MTDHPALVDQQGWREAVDALNSAGGTNWFQLEATINYGLGRIESLLRLVLAAAKSGDDASGVGIMDIVVALEQVQETLGDCDSEFNRISNYLISTQLAYYELKTAEKRERLLLGAFQLAALPETDVELLTRAAQTVAEVVVGDASFAPHWDVFCDVIRARGLVVDAVGDRLLPQLVSVKTPEAAEEDGRRRQAVADAMNEVRAADQMALPAKAGAGARARRASSAKKEVRHG